LTDPDVRTPYPFFLQNPVNRHFQILKITTFFLSLLFTAMPESQAGESSPNTLTKQERADGWRLLFDGKSAGSWRQFGKDVAPASGWEVSQGWLIKRAGAKPGNIVSREEFSNFEFSWEWRMESGGNNGVKYFVDETRGNLGHEYQMLAKVEQKPSKSSTGGFYAVLAPADPPPVRFYPKINASRIRVEGNKVTHWLNGRKILEYICGSEDVLSNVASSKFKKVAGFGEKLTARLMLTDHGSECGFRNLKIRELTAGSK
jgi:hypothetical protein